MIDYYCQADEPISSETPERREVFSDVLHDVPGLLDKNFKNSFKESGYSWFNLKYRYSSFIHLQIDFKLEVEKGRLLPVER